MLIISILALIIAVIALFMYLTAKEQMLNIAKQTFKSLVFISFGVSVFFFLINSITIVPAGHVGVIDLFGVVSSRILKSGINIVNPFAGVIKLSTRDK
jgi:repressor of nif and glnA expression